MHTPAHRLKKPWLLLHASITSQVHTVNCHSCLCPWPWGRACSWTHCRQLQHWSAYLSAAASLCYTNNWSRTWDSCSEYIPSKGICAVFHLVSQAVIYEITAAKYRQRLKPLEIHSKVIQICNNNSVKIQRGSFELTEKEKPEKERRPEHAQ